MAMNAQSRSLWMGDLEVHMDESFVSTAFAGAGFPCLGVKRILNKLTGLPAGYCFVEFSDPATSERALQTLQGAQIPGTMPLKRFRLNHAQHNRDGASAPEYSIFVGDITPEVTETAMTQFFQTRYPSTRGAKVVVDPNGNSRGYGFVRFLDETDQRRAIYELNGVRGLGSKPLRVSLATPKTQPAQTSSFNSYGQPQGYDYSQYQQQPPQQPPQQSQWGGYYGSQQPAKPQYDQYSGYPQQSQYGQSSGYPQHPPAQPSYGSSYYPQAPSAPHSFPQHPPSYPPQNGYSQHPSSSLQGQRFSAERENASYAKDRMGFVTETESSRFLNFADMSKR